MVTLKPQLEASTGPARALRNCRPGPCVPHRTRSHCRCGWWPVQDQLRLAGLVTRTPACPHRTRPPPQLWLEHAEGAGPGRRTGQTGPWGPPQHLVTLKPQLEASAGPARACQTGRPSPCVPHRTRFHCRCGCRPLQDRLGLSGTVSPAPACPNRTRSHCRCGWWPVQDQVRLAGLVTRTPACPHRTWPPPQLWLEHAEGAGPGRRTAQTGLCRPAQHSVTLKPQRAPSARPARARQTGQTGPWGPPLHLVTLKPQLEASAGPAWALRNCRPGPCVPHRTRSHCRCGWWPVQDRLRLAGLVTRTPACPHRTRPPPQLRLEHAEGAGPGRRTARTGPCGPTQHSVTLKPQLAPSARPAWARQTCRTGPWGPPQHLVTLKPQLEASARPSRACQTGRPGPCVPQQDSVKLQQWLQASAGPARAPLNGQPDACVPQQDSVTQQ